MKSQMGARNFRSSDGCRPSKDWITNFMRRWASELAFMEAFKGSSCDAGSINRARQLIHRNHLFDPDDWLASTDPSYSSIPSSSSASTAPSTSSTSTASQIKSGATAEHLEDASASAPPIHSSTAAASSNSTATSSSVRTPTASVCMAPPATPDGKRSTSKRLRMEPPAKARRGPHPLLHHHHSHHYHHDLFLSLFLHLHASVRLKADFTH